MKKVIFGGLAIVLLLAVMSIGALWVRTEPEPFAAGTQSAARLSQGPYSVGRINYDWIDTDRDQRSLPTTMWYPEGVAGLHPLAVFSHGLMSSRLGCTHMAEHLASYGYVVISADHPLTNADAPEGPDHFDVVNQPADLTFIIDKTLQLGESAPFEGSIDAQRIGAFGISLGADTVTLAGFHPERRDPRITLVASIVGHGDVFGPSFFDNAPVPFLMIAGTADAIVDYQVNAVPIPKRLSDGGLLTIEGATHAGFTYLTSGAVRLLGNPDNLGCGGVSEGDIPQDKNPFVGLFGAADQGLLVPSDYRAPCAKNYEHVMKAGRQQNIATLAIRAFFESRFATAVEDRRAHRFFLETTMAQELTEVTYQPASASSQRGVED